MRVLMLLMGLLGAWSAEGRDMRILVPAKVNGESISLAFDTGSDALILWESTLERHGIAFSKPSTPAGASDGTITVGFSEPFDLWVAGREVEARAGVYQPPSEVVAKLDGVLGWANIKGNLFIIDGQTKTVGGLEHLPDDLSGWSKWELVAEAKSLAFRVPGYGQVFIDTGSPKGFEAAAEEWERICRGGKATGVTLSASITLYRGLTVREEHFHEELELGSLRLENIAVMPSVSGVADRYGAVYKGTLGLAGLSRLEVIVDGVNGFVYTRPVARATVSDHNRLGAVFTPKTPRDDTLVARVVVGGPAHEAGVRDGDQLLKIDGVDFTNWRTMPDRKAFGDYWSQPAGTQIALTVRRGSDTLIFSVTLRDILVPKSSKEKETK